MVRVESVVLFEGQTGTDFALVPALEEEEEEREEADDKAGHGRGADLVGVDARDGTEDLAEGDLEVIGDFA